MSAKHIIVLVVLGLANLCVLGIGFALLLTPPPAQPVATLVPFEAGVMATASAPPPPTNTPSPMPPTPRPTNTLVVRATPEPTRTPYPTFTFTNVLTLTQTATPTQSLKTTLTPNAASTQPASSLPATVKPTTKPAAPPAASAGGCDNPPSGQLAGKLEVNWSYIGFAGVPDTNNAKVTMQIFATGGNGCYKYNIAGVTHDRQPISFLVRQCASTPVSLIVTSRDGQTWKQDFIVEVYSGDGFQCR